MNKYIVILFLFIPLMCKTQNLVPNNSFENYIVCPNTDDISNAPPWFNPTGPYPLTSPNLLNTCAPPIPPGPGYGIPQNGWGYQFPHSGNGYAGIYVFADYEKGREYLSVKLDSILEIGKIYCIGYYVSFANKGIYQIFAIDRMGAYLSDTAIHLNTGYIIPIVPQIENPTGHFLSDTLNWMLVSGTYVAHGGEQYITIGNFYANDSTNYTPTNITNTISFYYIDDVYVGRCDTAQPPSENTLSISNAFTPNNDGINDLFKVQGQNIKIINGKIFNRWGEKLFEWNDLNSGWDGKHNGQDVSEGVYYYVVSITFENGEIQEKHGSLELIR